jgi:hypothetical protein
LGGSDIGIVAVSRPRDDTRFPGLTIREGARSLPQRCPHGTINSTKLEALGRTSMKKVNRRSALKIGFAAASAAVVKPSFAQTTDPLSGKDTSPWPGVVVRLRRESVSNPWI